MKKTNEQKQNLKQSIFWLPVVLTLILLPLLVSYQVCQSRLSEFAWSNGTEKTADIFLRCKQQFFTLLTAIIVLFLAYRCYEERIQLKNEFRKQWYMLIPAGIYLILAFVSSVCSEYKIAAFSGSDEQFESFWCLAGYIFFMLYLVLILRSQSEIKLVLYSVAVLAAIMGGIGILQYLGHDPFMWTWVQKLITPEGYLETIGPITQVFEEGRVSLTSYNPNYAGVLLTMLSTLCFGMTLTERNKKRLITEFLLLVVLLVSLIGTGSRAGFLVFVAVAIAAVLFSSKQLLKHWKMVLPMGVLLLASGVCAVFYSKLPIIENLKTALTIEKSAENPLQEITTSSEGIHITYRNRSFTVTYQIQEEDFSVYVEDSNSTEVELITSAEDMAYYPVEETLSDMILQPVLIGDSRYGLCIRLNGIDWPFIFLEDGYYYINHYGRLEQLKSIDRIGFGGYETLATSRGLIWSMTLPLLQDHLVLGSGANTFVFEYPQSNYSDMLFYNGEIVLVTRPHNMYLQIAVESGVLALLALLVFFGWYLLQSLRICWKSKQSTVAGRTSFACFLAVAAYLICGLTNDSMIAVAPVFWGILGLGIAANRLEEKEQIRNISLNSEKE